MSNPMEPMNQAQAPCYGIIPARYESSRFPGKPLALILGKPMFVHVYERARQCKGLKHAALATDDERIARVADEYGVPWLMTDANCPSGTDRVFQAAQKLGVEDDAVVINIQGDEPALSPQMLDQMAAAFCDPAVQVATLCNTLTGREAADAANNPDRVKVVLAANGDALYFSRSPVPWRPGGVEAGVSIHVGMYAYRLPALQRFTSLPPSALEKQERLEQLRLLENNLPIRVLKTDYIAHGVDRPEDIALVESLLKETE